MGLLAGAALVSLGLAEGTVQFNELHGVMILKLLGFPAALWFLPPDLCPFI